MLRKGAVGKWKTHRSITWKDRWVSPRLRA
jgi:hypothetical protein